jgi:hypothetical protein
MGTPFVFGEVSAMRRSELESRAMVPPGGSVRLVPMG